MSTDKDTQTPARGHKSDEPHPLPPILGEETTPDLEALGFIGDVVMLAWHFVEHETSVPCSSHLGSMLARAHALVGQLADAEDDRRMANGGAS